MSMHIDSLSPPQTDRGRMPDAFKARWVHYALTQLGGNRFDSRGGYAPRFDAGETGFTQRALTHISTELSPTLIPPLEARKWIPTVVEGNAGDATYLWRKPTRTGIARFFAPGGVRDLPTVGAFVEEISTPYYTVGAQVQWDYFELLAIGAALANGQPFDFVAERLIAAMEANEKKLDYIGAFGSASPPASFAIEVDADVGLTGILNNASITQYTIPNGAAGSKSWALKTADEVVADLAGIVGSQRSTTFKVHAPNTMLMPIAEKQALISRRMSDISNTSILEYFTETQRKAGQPIDVYDWQAMSGSGDSGSDQFMVYNRDTRMLKHVLSTDKAVLPATTQGLTTTQIVYSRTAGVVIRYPLSITAGSHING